jgi:hypothetical protein
MSVGSVLEGELRKVAYECLSRVCEWHWAFPWRVDDHEQVNPRCHHGGASLLALDVEREARPEEEESHEGESGEEEVPSPERVDCVDSRYGEKPVRYPTAQGYKERVFSAEPCVGEHGRGVIHDGVDAAELCLLAEFRCISSCPVEF